MDVGVSHLRCEDLPAALSAAPGGVQAGTLADAMGMLTRIDKFQDDIKKKYPNRNDKEVKSSTPRTRTVCEHRLHSNLGSSRP